VARHGRWWSRVDWGKVGTVAAVILGAGSLLLTAVATYYGAMVSKDQLEQSQEDATRQERGQALLVTHWADETASGHWQVHILNRSVDPITGVKAEALLEREDKVDRPTLIRQVAYDLNVGDLAPCTELIYDEDDFSEAAWSANKNGSVAQELHLPIVVNGSVGSTDFTDSNGYSWERSLLGLEVLNDEWRSPVRSRDLFSGEAKGSPAVKRATACGAA
jgi:hypothetical protein